MTTLLMTHNGRIVIPKTLRDQLNLHEGDEILAEIEDGRLILSTRATRLTRARALIQKYCPKQPGESVVDAFIAERRKAADSE
ncbi:MAG: AbrB/MazE/SpoVT family DNA-binding domain-containing protein [Rhodocyclaceae bacterium]|nr:AbrB/MazE/SpoVT family DNA-binding domain-containing protein [Rhodocyclaceae bacterium]